MVLRCLVAVWSQLVKIKINLFSILKNAAGSVSRKRTAIDDGKGANALSGALCVCVLVVISECYTLIEVLFLQVIILQLNS